VWCFCVVACVCLVSWGIVARARREKSEFDVIQRLRDIRAAETTFRERHSRFGAVAALFADGLLAPRTTDDAEGAFRFEFSADLNGYAVAAIPAKRDDRYQYVGWSFFLDDSGVIRGAAYGKANAYRAAGRADEPIPQQ
jgi:hypothetical protein